MHDLAGEIAVSGNVELDARRAEEIMRDPVMQRVMSDMRQDATDVWISARTTEQREAAWHDYQSTVRFNDKLQARLTEVSMRKARK